MSAAVGAASLSNPRKWALLTGAGFSANWGTPTIATLWGELLRHPAVQARPKLVDALLAPDGFNFETILARTQDEGDGNFEERDRDAMNAAVLEAYGRIDRIVVGAIPKVANAGRFAEQVLNLFWGRDGDLGQPGFVFTLNQDLLVERIVAMTPGQRSYYRPCVPNSIVSAHYGATYAPTYGATVDFAQGVKVDALEKAPSGGWPRSEGGRHYVKLHGSWDWRDREGGRDMILGGDKERQIDARPLLAYYKGLLKGFVMAGERRLCVLGYSFRDPHINRILLEGVYYAGLKIHVWDLAHPSSLRDLLQKHDDDLAAAHVPGTPLMPLWKALCGYTQAPLAAILDDRARYEDWHQRTLV